LLDFFFFCWGEWFSLKIAVKFPIDMPYLRNLVQISRHIEFLKFNISFHFIKLRNNCILLSASTVLLWPGFRKLSENATSWKILMPFKFFQLKI
jgi:hypothetical protein